MCKWYRNGTTTLPKDAIRLSATTIRLRRLFRRNGTRAITLDNITNITLVRLFGSIHLHINTRPLTLVNRQSRRNTFFFTRIRNRNTTLETRLNNIIRRIRPSFFRRPLTTNMLYQGGINVGVRLLLPPLLLNRRRTLTRLFVRQRNYFINRSHLTLRPIRNRGVHYRINRPPTLIPSSNRMFLLVLKQRLLLRRRINGTTSASSKHFRLIKRIISGVLPRGFDTTRLLHHLIRTLLGLSRLPKHMAIFHKVRARNGIPIYRFFRDLGIPLR